MSLELHPDLERAIGACSFDSGRLTIKPRCDCKAEMVLKNQDDQAVSDVTAFLYTHFYSERCSVQCFRLNDPTVLLGARLSDPEFVEMLRRCNPFAGYFNGGWELVGTVASHPKLIRLRKAGITIEVDGESKIRIESCLADGTPKSIGVLFPAESLRAMPGFYLGYSNQGPAEKEGSSRIYLNLSYDRLELSLTYLLKAIEKLGIPLAFKVLADRRQLSRTDSVVFYVRRIDLCDALRIIVGLHGKDKTAFLERNPPFTYVVHPGIAVADEPKLAGRRLMSFGEHRCQLLANVLCKLIGKQDANVRMMRSMVTVEYEAIDLDPQRPYVNSRISKGFEDAVGW
jgi:hypothetical protein